MVPRSGDGVAAGCPSGALSVQSLGLASPRRPPARYGLLWPPGQAGAISSSVESRTRVAVGARGRERARPVSPQ